MKKLWCSIWRAFLNAFDDAVDHIAYAIDTLTPPVLNLLSGIGEVAGEVIKDVGGAVSGVFNSSRLLWGGLLIGGFFLLNKSKDKEDHTKSKDKEDYNTSKARRLMDGDFDDYQNSTLRTS